MAMSENLVVSDVGLALALAIDGQTSSDTINENTFSIKDCSQEELLQKHRKERKEFQGQVQSIRKLAAKADKKKKKEAAEQIAKLELELDKQQNEELHQFEINKLSENIGKMIENDVRTVRPSTEASSTNNQPQQRVTKAQKRRDKKVNKSKERELQIEAQEVENIHGARNVETQKIKKILKERNLMIHEIPSDGDCLYCAIDHQWQCINGKAIGLENLRMKTAEFLRANKSDFLPFIIHPDTEDMLTEEQFEEYCSKVANTPAWGGEVELRALSHVLNCPIEVVQSIGPSIVVGKEYKGSKSAIVLTYHRHMYSLGEHYNSVRPFEELQEDETQPTEK